MSALFNSVGTGATIAPIVYNGSLGRGKIEKLYTSYARSALSLGNMLSGLGMGATKADGEKASSVESDDDDTDAVDPETKMIRLGQLEVVDPSPSPSPSFARADVTDDAYDP